MSQPRIAKFDSSVVIEWSDGTLFSGYLYIALIAPTYGGSDDATSIEVKNFAPPCQVPNRIPVPVKDGKINGSCGLFYNADLRPPNTRYEYCLFDTTKRQVTSFSTPFLVTADPVTLPVLTPTAPTYGSNVPQPN